MRFNWPDTIFVTGTDTNVGKTVVSAILTTGLQASYWKPIQSGLDPYADTDWIATTCKIAKEHLLPERYRLSNPLSPHLAARLDGVQISLSDFSLPKTATGHLIIEGAGGLLVPINDSHLVIDLIEKFDIPAILVSRSTLGTINHTLLSLNLMRQKRICILGVVMNGPPNEENRLAIEHFGKAPVIAQVPFFEPLNKENLESAFQKYFSLHEVQNDVQGASIKTV